MLQNVKCEISKKMLKHIFSINDSKTLIVDIRQESFKRNFWHETVLLTFGQTLPFLMKKTF